MPEDEFGAIQTVTGDVLGSADTLALVLTAATWAQALFCLSCLLRRAWEYPLYLPLAALFLILCFASGGPLIATFAPSWLNAFYELTVPAYLLMGPVLWFYFEGLMAETRWTPQRAHLVHLLPAAMGLILILLDIMVVDVTPVAPHVHLLKQAYIAVVAIMWAATLVGWLWQSAYITRALWRRLPLYRQRLNMTLSNHDYKTLWGAEWVLPAITGFWVVVLGGIIIRNMTGIDYPPSWAVAAVFTVLVWSLGLWSLRQVPGLADSPKDTVDDVTTIKYQKSALSPEQAQRIATRLAAAMETEALYLDANLSLPVLARHMRIAANPISQTLNSVIGLSFFDYVNHWRVNAAKTELANSDKGILDIAYDAGFNARSSFYRAFQKETGMTPVAYRQQQRDQASTSASRANS